MPIRLTLALLALPLVPFQESNPLVCKHVNPSGISTNNRSACNANGVVCTVQFLFIQDQDGNCFVPTDCQWLFNIMVSDCANVAQVCITYLTATGVQTCCEQIVDGSAGPIGPAAVILDCGTQSNSQFFITFKDASGKKIGRCQPVFQCLQCAAVIEQP